MNWWEVLKVSPRATQEDIHKAYKKRARELHPDKNINDPTAKTKFQDLQVAYDQATKKSLPVYSAPRGRSYTRYRPKASDIHCELKVTIAQVLNSKTVSVIYVAQGVDGRNKRKRLSFDLSPNTRNGIKTYVGYGHTPTHGQPGDVKIRITINYGEFKVKGSQLSIVRDITLLQTFKGTPIPITLPSGEVKDIVCPWIPGEALTDSHAIVAFQGLGREDGSRGHFRVDFRIVTPDIPETRKELFLYALDDQEEPQGPPTKRSKKLSG